MTFNSINIIGLGNVGKECSYLCEKNNIKFNVCDKFIKKGKFNYFDNIYDLINFSEIKDNNDINYYFIAIPTPINKQKNRDISMLYYIIKQISEFKTKNTVIIIKSIICPGTAIQLHNKFTNLDIVLLCSEFLNTENYLNDIYNSNYILIGNYSLDLFKFQDILKLFRKLYSHNNMIDIISKNYEECELFTQALSEFFIIKINFFNKIYKSCQLMNVDYKNLKLLFELDSRISNYGITIESKLELTNLKPIII